MVIVGAAVAVAACATVAAAVLARTSSSSSYDDGRNGATVAVETSSPTTSQECAVCLSVLEAGAESSDCVLSESAAVRTLPACGHGFHAECIGRWLPLRPECPLCRRPVQLADGQTAARAVASSATAAPAWARPARIACGFGDGRVVWTRSPSVQQ
ncbi:E3 ubiquitin-protein ligase Os06g0535400-like [Phragmites australis]|uniref:E3 ubiquitin-protein ligase Os06g0535400-like n=1 Tax=Phragmites australis TaxID=29695 RepID=UPI002D781C8D|nr:E3 ubiquitin-protein ligase Os06g0535400-like [Phragmites australis]